MRRLIAPGATAQLGRPLDTLIDMLTYRRPHGSVSEHAFIDRFLMPLGVTSDAFGNLMLDFGAAPAILWSSHTDSCHRTGGRQTIAIVGDTVAVADPQSNCLGADDATGVWIMREMILAGIPGRYVFHRGEERGGLGSRFIAGSTPELLDGIQAAIAFDRRGTGSIITHQAGGRSASDAFASSLGMAIGLGLAPDPTGTFTDTASYMDLVGECTNISVGYEAEHTPRETLDLGHLLRLREAMVAFDASGLVFERRPGEDDADDWRSWPSELRARGRSRRLYDLVFDHPGAVARFLEDCGIAPDDLADYIAAEEVM